MNHWKGNSLKGYISPALREDARKLNKDTTTCKCFPFPTQNAALQAAEKLPGMELFAEDLVEDVSFD